MRILKKTGQVATAALLAASLAACDAGAGPSTPKPEPAPAKDGGALTAPVDAAKAAAAQLEAAAQGGAELHTIKLAVTGMT